MPRGLPAAGDRGLDHTHTWGRTYWGGAMFCLLADVEIRQHTHNRMGLQDALRAILKASGGAGGGLADPSAVLRTGDAAVGGDWCSRIFMRCKDAAVTPDLMALWKQLGVEPDGATVRLNDAAPLADVRRAIMRAPAPNSLKRRPQLAEEPGHQRGRGQHRADERVLEHEITAQRRQRARIGACERRHERELACGLPARAAPRTTAPSRTVSARRAGAAPPDPAAARRASPRPASPSSGTSHTARREKLCSTAAARGAGSSSATWRSGHKAPNQNATASTCSPSRGASSVDAYRAVRDR